MQEKFGATALMIVSQQGHLETVKLLLHRGASVNSQRKVRVLYCIAGRFGEIKILISSLVVCLHNCQIKIHQILLLT